MLPPLPTEGQVSRYRLLHRVWPRCPLARVPIVRLQRLQCALPFGLCLPDSCLVTHFAASSATTSAKEFASVWWKSILFCLIADGPTPNVTYIFQATAPVYQLEKGQPQVTIWPLFQLTPVCDTSRHILRINRNLDIRLFVDSAEDLDGSPKLGSWNPLSLWHLASQETGVLQLERCVTENLHRESGHSKCDRSQIFRSVAAASRSVRGYQHIVVGTRLSHIVTSVLSAISFARDQSRGKRPLANKT